MASLSLTSTVMTRTVDAPPYPQPHPDPAPPACAAPVGWTAAPVTGTAESRTRR